MDARNINRLVASHTHLSPIGCRTRNPGVFPDQEWNWWPFALQDDAQPTEPLGQGNRTSLYKNTHPYIHTTISSIFLHQALYLIFDIGAHIHSIIYLYMLSINIHPHIPLYNSQILCHKDAFKI